jgi:uncharacterized protein
MGVTQDYVQAHIWFNLAASTYDVAHKNDGRDQALKDRDIVAAKMTQAQIAEAQRLAQICAQDLKDCGVSRSPAAYQEAKPSPTPQDLVTSTGTGFFVSHDGHIITNAHVVEACLLVTSSRGGQISEVSIDEQSDLALFVAAEKPKVFAHLRGGYGARIAEPVVAVGFPLSGLLSSDPIVTTGIVSASQA